MEHRPTTFVLLDPTAPGGECALDRLTADDENVALVVLLGLESSSALREYAAVESLELVDAAMIYLEQVAARVEQPGRRIELVPLEGDPATALGALQDESDHWRLLLPNVQPGPSLPGRAPRVKSWWPARVVDHLSRPLPGAAGALAASPLARRVPAGELVKLDRLGTVVRVDAGTRLIEQGRVGKMVCVVVEGALSVERDNQQIASLGPGEVAGEIALISGERCNADVVAAEDSSLLVFNGVEFAELLDSCPRVTKHLLQSTVRRLQPA